MSMEIEQETHRPESPHPRDKGQEMTAARANRLLQLLPENELLLILAEARSLTLKPLQLLAEPGAPLDHVYFPLTCVISMLRRMRDGSTVEAGAIGRQGMAGICVALGNTWASEAIVASVPGTCLCLPAPRFRELLPQLSTLGQLLDRYALAFIDQLGQTIACNNLHSVEQRAIGWLLNAHDSAGADEFYLTHEVLARMLGVRRAGVTVAALVLQREKIIRYTRGRVAVLDRLRLEAVACECYSLMRKRSDQLLAADSPRR